MSMSHEPKSPSLGMISTATRTTATVSPLTPSPISSTVLANGNTASQSAHSGFAAALRKLAKQAEEPRGPTSISGESSPVSSPATNHSSPVGTPKRGPLASGPGLGAPSAAHAVSSTPPVVTIAPTKTVNGMWRSEGRQAEAAMRGPVRERLPSEPPPPSPHQTQDKSVSSLPPHLMGAHYPFGLNPSAVMQDPRLQALNLSRQMPHVLQSGAVPVGAVPLGAVPEEYLRSGFRPYGSAEDLRLSSLPLGLDPGYFRSGYLAYPALSSYRMDESLCLSALRSSYYQLPAGGAVPSLHPNTAHLHLPGVRYPAELSHQSLTALQSERLQMEDKLRQREREREKERAHEAERERERERVREREREEERERELERQKERAKEREVQAVRAMEKHVLSQELHTHTHSHPHRQQIEDRAKLTPNQAEKTKEAMLLAPKPLQPGLYPSPGGSAPLPMPSLVPTPGERLGPGALLLQRQGEEERWLARQRRLRADTADRQGPACSQHSTEPEIHDPQTDTQRPNSRHQDLTTRELPHHLGAPPPLISPKPNPPTTLWNPVSLINSPSHTRRAYDSPFPPSRPPPGLTKPECPDRGLPPRTPGLLEPSTFLTEQEKSSQSILNKQRLSFPLPAPFGEFRGTKRAGSPIRGFLQCPSREPTLVYDYALQQHRTLLSKLDLEEKRRREAREKGYYYELDDSYDESDEEEVRAHLKRVTEQPPLKLDQSKEKLGFLAVFGLTTLSHRDALLERKKKKRRKIMRERSPSPVPAQSKRPTPSTATPTLSTRYTPEEMDRAPELENKKHFLNMFNLNHVSQEQRIEKEKVVSLLDAIKKKTVTLDTLRYAPRSPCSSPPTTASDPPAPSTPCQSNGEPHPNSHSPAPPGPAMHPHSVSQPELHRPSQASDLLHPKQPPPLAPLQDQSRLGEAPAIRRAPSLQNSFRPPLTQLKERPHGLNGLSDHSRSRPWDSLSAEEFAQHFHQSVLQSTHKSQHKLKGGVPAASEPNHKLNNVMRYHPPEHQGVLNRLPYSHINGHSGHPAAHHESRLSDERSAEEESTEEDDDDDEEEEEEEEDCSPKWKGIEAIVEAYQEYIDERNIESEVLQSECRRMEAQHYHLSVTADQLSVSMGELLAQRQRLALDRERMQAELEHFRKCLALPALLLHRGHYKGPPPR
ncbi:genetic suppressor element 1-like isoform X2 [Neoarius graeffei]|uniref:genetic suppressor element 1-like isoform X2 n=1 Tax=Neoarius graeffei TaxID=443677 RepID=UPI00298CB378|nr:genetic suppressor element 1-like isoform X2 [Neoarius graeffei]